MTGRTTSGGSTILTPPAIRVKKIEANINKKVTAMLRERLGLKSNQKLPADLADLVSAASITAGQAAVETAVLRDVEEAAAELARGSVLNRFDAKVGLASASLDHIKGSSDVERILKRRSEMLATKKKSLEDAGFSDSESMAIILADIAARGH